MNRVKYKCEISEGFHILKLQFYVLEMSGILKLFSVLCRNSRSSRSADGAYGTGPATYGEKNPEAGAETNTIFSVLHACARCGHVMRKERCSLIDRPAEQVFKGLVCEAV